MLQVPSSFCVVIAMFDTGLSGNLAHARIYLDTARQNSWPEPVNRFFASINRYNVPKWGFVFLGVDNVILCYFTSLNRSKNYHNESGQGKRHHCNGLVKLCYPLRTKRSKNECVRQRPNALILVLTYNRFRNLLHSLSTIRNLQPSNHPALCVGL